MSIFNFNDFIWLVRNRYIILKKSLLEDEINRIKEMLEEIK